MRLLAAVTLLALSACNARIEAVDPAADAEAGREAGCCPVDPAPACSMRYGGWSDGGPYARCSRVFDGMPVPSDPGWSRRVDEHGCAYWHHPYRDFGSGGPVRRCLDLSPHDDAGDAAVDAPSDGGDAAESAGDAGAGG
jgi:hypothetical protein